MKASWSNFRETNLKDASSRVYTFFNDFLEVIAPAQQYVWSISTTGSVKVWSILVAATDFFLANTYLTPLAVIAAIIKLPKVSGVLLAGLVVTTVCFFHWVTSPMSSASFIRIIGSSFITAFALHYLFARLPHHCLRAGGQAIAISRQIGLLICSGFTGRQPIPTWAREFTIARKRSAPKVATRRSFSLSREVPGAVWSHDDADDKERRSASPTVHVETNPSTSRTSSLRSLRAVPTHKKRSQPQADRATPVSRRRRALSAVSVTADESFSDRSVTPLISPTETARGLYEIERLERSRINSVTHLTEYWVIWKGYPSAQGEWKTAEDLIEAGCEKSICKFNSMAERRA